jgi:hypothetical protein
VAWGLADIFSMVGVALYELSAWLTDDHQVAGYRIERGNLHPAS